MAEGKKEIGKFSVGGFWKWQKRVEIRLLRIEQGQDELLGKVEVLHRMLLALLEEACGELNSGYERGGQERKEKD